MKKWLTSLPIISSIPEEYWHLARISLSIFSQTVVLPLAITVDTLIVGHLLGTVDLAGLSIGAVIMNTILGIGVFVIVSTNASVAQSVGAKNPKKTVEIIINTLAMSAILGVILAVAGYALVTPATYVFDVTEEVRLSAQHYMQGYMISFPIFVIDMSCSGIMRGLRKYKPLTMATFTSFILNIPLVLTFLLVFDWGIFGTGLASGLAIWIETILKLYFVSQYLRQHQFRTRPSLAGVFVSFGEGVPILIRECVLWSTNLFLVYSFGVLGTAAVAGIQVMDSIWVFVLFALDSLAQGITTLVGEKIGNRDYAGAKTTLRRAIRLALGYGGLLSLLLLSSAWFFPGLFTPDPEVSFYAMMGLLEAGCVLCLLAYTFVIEGALFATKDTKFLAMVSIIAMVIYFGSGWAAINTVPHNGWGFLIILTTYDGIYMGIRALFARYRKDKDRWLDFARRQNDKMDWLDNQAAALSASAGVDTN
jgi:putative MATE family efflux protein